MAPKIPLANRAVPPVALVSTPLDVAALTEAANRPEAGAVCVFVGTVRSPNLGREVLYLDYEAHAPMAEAQMRHIVEDAADRWPGCQARLHHRLGRLAPGEASVVIVVSALHRGDAFEACRSVIERVKTDVPIWKKEVFGDGSVWVGAPPPNS